jgi:formylglycine-generating enzyme required for sulfatase activity
MVAIESTFCIDRTEVSNAAYEKFLAKHPQVADQDAFCAWNGDFSFDTEPDSCKTRQTGGDYPASCINWCDARAYCQSIGKRLCGALHGGPNPQKDLAKAGVDEWYTACSKDGALTYPTDGVYDPTQCNGDSNGAVPVGTPGMEVCEGGYLGLMHMSGNVREWEDSCSGSTGAEDQCLTRGGAFDSGTTANGSWSLLSCAVEDPRSRDDTDATIGFRCCSG